MDKKDRRRKFIEKLKQEFPEKEGFLDSLRENDNYSVDKLLHDNIGLNMSSNEIVEAFRSGRQDDVKRRAEADIRRRKLLHDWIELKAKRLV